MSEERENLNIVATIIPSKSKEGEFRNTYTVQSRTKDDGTDYFVSTFNCATLDRIYKGNAYIQEYFWSRIFYNPVVENTSVNAKMFKKNIDDIRTGKIKAGCVVYLSGVAEKGGLFIKSPIQCLCQDIRTIQNGQRENIVGKILNYSENNILTVLCPIFDENGKEKATKLALMRLCSQNSENFLNYLPRDENNLIEAIGKSYFVFNAVKNNTFMDVSHIQGTNSVHRFTKIISASAGEIVNTNSINNSARYNERKNSEESFNH